MPESAAVDVAGAAVAVVVEAVEPGSLAGLHYPTFDLHFASPKQLYIQTYQQAGGKATDACNYILMN